MKVVGKVENENIATVYIAEINGKLIEFVESLTPPLKRDEKWVLMVSTLFGCPVKCIMCDACGDYKGKLSKEEILAQIDYMVRRYFPNGKINVKKFKIQFARMGEPSFNNAVLEVLDGFHGLYQVENFIPSISTIAPKGRDRFFERLKEIKDKRYRGMNFQLQFSIHSTDEDLRDWIIPIPKLPLAEIARFGEAFYKEGDRKITLNFALAKEFSLNPYVLINHFDPNIFLIKITPLNPTFRAKENNLSSYIDPFHPDKDYPIVEELSSLGYNVIVSIGEPEENNLGSNCGQYVTGIKHGFVGGAYEYPVKPHI